MTNQIPPSGEALSEASNLVTETLADIELDRIPLAIIALKASRLARLLNRFDAEKIFRLEAGGYTTTPTGVPPDAWRLAQLAGRTYQEKDPKDKQINTYAYIESIPELEAQIEAAKLGIRAAQNGGASTSTFPPQTASPFLYSALAPSGNFLERRNLREHIAMATRRLAQRRAFIHRFLTRVYIELRFSQIAQDIFAGIRAAVDSNIGRFIPDSIQKFAAVYDGLNSSNPEDWSNAAHSCRRILQDLADSLFPPQKDSRYVEKSGKELEIKLGADNFINRLICFIEDKAKSGRYTELVGSHLKYIGDRLDAIFAATQKGSHAQVSKKEANRYAVYTYMIVGDILALAEDTTTQHEESKEPQST